MAWFGEPLVIKNIFKPRRIYLYAWKQYYPDVNGRRILT